MKTWILVANSAEAKLFVTENLRTGELDLIREFSHPESRKKVADLITDKQGSFRTDAEGHGSYSNTSDPKEMEADHFAAELAKELKSGFDQHQFKKLLIVAADHFSGLINKHFKVSGVSEIEVNRILKDYTKIESAKLHARIKEHVFI